MEWHFRLPKKKHLFFRLTKRKQNKNDKLKCTFNIRGDIMSFS